MNKICNYYITLRCNDSCEFCPIWQNDEYKKIEEKPFDLSVLKNSGVKVLNITGGEPLLSENLPQVLTQARQLGFKTILTTNGILYPDKARLINGLVDRLFVSIDYPFAEEHDRIRGTECFHQAVRSIKLAQELKSNPAIKYTMTRDTVRYLPEMIELAERLRTPVYLNPVYDFQGTQGFDPMTIQHIKYFSRRKVVINNAAVIEFAKKGGNLSILPRCRARETTITILPDGSKVSPCFFNQNGVQGREPICSGCLRWDYIEPSLAYGFDKYFFLSFFGGLANRLKKII